MSKYVTEWNQKKVLAQVSGRVADNLYEACEFAAGQARARAPRRTGRLVAGVDIAVEVVAQGQVITGWVGVIKQVFYAFWQEMGTRRHPAHPFLRPAVFNNAKRIVDIVSGK